MASYLVEVAVKGKYRHWRACGMSMAGHFVGVGGGDQSDRRE